MISCVMLVQMPVRREDWRSSFNAVCRPINPSDAAAPTAEPTSAAILAFCSSSSSQSERNSSAKSGGRRMPSEAARSRYVMETPSYSVFICCWLMLS